jgi:hypothetical protein
MRLRDLVRDRAVALYALLTAVFFHEPLTTKTFFFRDVYQFFYPKKVLLASALQAGTFPLWDPFTNGGQPYLATPTTAALHPSNLLYAVMPVLVAFNVIPVLHVFFCAVTAYWLGRVVGLARTGAFVTGIAYAFCGVTLSGGNLSAWLLALPWIPLTIGLTHRALRDGRSLVPAAVAAAMPLIAGMAEITAFQFLLLFVWIAAAKYNVSPVRRAFVAALVVAGGIGLSLVATLPATSVIAQSARGLEKRTYESFTGWSVHPRRLPELVVPQFFGPTNTLGDEYWGRKFETEGFPYVLSIYFGIPLLVLAAFGAVTRTTRIDAPRRALAFAAIATILLSLGQYLPGFRLLYDYVPLVAIFRFPVKVMILAIVPVALLAGCGVEAISRRRGAIASLALLPLLALFLIDVPRNAYTIASFAHAATACIAFAAALFLPRRTIAIAAVVTIDLLLAGYRVNAYAPRDIYDEPPIANAVREAVGPLRFYAAPISNLVVQAPSNDISYIARWQLATLNDYTASAFGIPAVFHTDFDGLAPLRMAQMGNYVGRAPWARRKAIFDRAGVRAFRTPDEVKLQGVVEIGRVRTPMGMMRYYENRDAVAARFIGKCGVAPVTILRRDLNASRYGVDAPCDGRVIFAETFYDGWRTSIDGVEAPQVRADYAFAAVDVRAGRHLIERRYFPPRLIGGLFATLGTALLIVLIDRRLRAARTVLPAGSPDTP